MKEPKPKENQDTKNRNGKGKRNMMNKAEELTRNGARGGNNGEYQSGERQLKNRNGGYISHCSSTRVREDIR